MGTRNFAYDNRCIVVTDEDYEIGNVPKLGESDYDRNYPSRNIAEDDMPEFNFWTPVITIGYYADACIDYVRTERNAEYWLGRDIYYNTKNDVIEECIKVFKLSRYRLNKILPKLYKDREFGDWYWDAIEALTEYLAEIEEKKVNEYLDELKAKYGYEEVGLVATMSNGVGIYEKVS